MLDQHHRGAELVVDIQNKAAHVLFFFDVHARHGLIEQQHLGFERQRAAQIDALLQAIGQLPHGGFAVRLDFQKVDDLLDIRPVLHFFALGRADAQGLQQYIAFDAQVAPGHDVVEHAHALEQGQVLKGARNAHLGHLAAVHVVKGLAPKSNGALLGRVHAIDAIEHRAFARSVGANDGADFVLAHIERNIGQGLHAPKGQADVFHIQHNVANALAHAALPTGANSLASLKRKVALTLPLRPSSNLTAVSMNCVCKPPYKASTNTWYLSAM